MSARDTPEITDVEILRHAAEHAINDEMPQVIELEDQRVIVVPKGWVAQSEQALRLLDEGGLEILRDYEEVNPDSNVFLMQLPPRRNYGQGHKMATMLFGEQADSWTERLPTWQRVDGEVTRIK